MIFTSFFYIFVVSKNHIGKAKVFCGHSEFLANIFHYSPCSFLPYSFWFVSKHQSSLPQRQEAQSLGLACAFMTYSLSLLRPLFTSGFLAVFERMDFLINEIIQSPLLECILCALAFSALLLCVFKELPEGQYYFSYSSHICAVHQNLSLQ